MSWFNFGAKINQSAAGRVYLDYAAATPLSPQAKRVMLESERLYANPSGLHKEGVAAREAIEAARLRLARTLKVRPEGVIFTGNGTESNNLAIYGLLRELKAAGRDFSDVMIISTELEHPSVSEVLEHAKELGVEVQYCEVNEEGIIDLKHFESLLSEKTVLVTCSYVNSEIGVIQPIGRIRRAIKKFNEEQSTDIKFHLDAAQAPLWLPCQLDTLGVDTMTLDAGKCQGSKGVGVLVTRHGVHLKGVLLGGGQEFGLRAGTENTSSILSAVEAIVNAQDNHESNKEIVTKLRDELIETLEEIEGVVLNGSKTERVANNVNISINGVDGEFAVVALDEKGFAVSTKSACSGAGGGGSKVVEMISGDKERSQSTIRITLGPNNTKAELSRFVAALKEHVTKTREAQAKLIQH